MKKQNLVITLVTNNINDVVKLMFKHPVIVAYIDRINPVGDAVIRNDCYAIVYNDIEAANRGKKTKISVYLNPAYMVCA